MDITSILPTQGANPRDDLFAPPPKAPVSTEIDDMVELAIGIDPEARKTLANQALEKEVNAGLEDGTLDRPKVDALAARYNQEDEDDVLAGVVHGLADDGDSVKDITGDQIKANRRAVGQLAIQALEASRTDFANAGADAVAAPVTTFVTKVLPDIAGNVLSLSTSQRALSAMRSVFPEIGSRLGVGQSVTKMQELIAGMQPAEAQVKIDQLVQAARDQGNDGLWESDTQTQWITSILLGSLTDLAADPTAPISNKMNAAAAYLEMAGVPVAALRGAMAGFQAVKGVASITAPFRAAGLNAGSAAEVVSSTKAGAERMWELFTGRATGKVDPRFAPGTSSEDILDTLALPKLLKEATQDGPFIATALVPEATRATLAADPAWLFGAALVPRMNGTYAGAQLLDGGLTATVQVGTKAGRGFNSEAAAKAAATREFPGAPNVSVAQNGNSWFIEVSKTRQFGLSDINEAPNMTGRGYSWWRRFGKAASSGSDYANFSSNNAARTGEQVATAARDLTKPYWDLPAGSQRRVAAVLDEGDETKTLFDLKALREKGLRDKEIAGYFAVRKLAQVNRQIKNINLHHKWTAKGYRGVTLAGIGQTGIKPVTMTADESVTAAVMQMEGIPAASIRAWDGTAGVPTTLAAVAPNQRVVRLMSPGPGGEKFAIMDVRDMTKHTDLPLDFIPDVAGYLPRPYKYPAYVKAFDASGRATTLRPARSMAEAESLAVELKAGNPGQRVEAVIASELRVVSDEDELAELFDAGLLYNSTRGPSRLLDAVGGTRMPTVGDRIQSMMTDTAFRTGLARWSEVQKLAWHNRWGKLFEGRFNPGMNPAELVVKGNANAKDVAQARHEAMFINNTSGVGEVAKAGMLSESSSTVAEWFYRGAVKADEIASKLRGDKAGSKIGSDLRALADNIVGLDGRLLGNIKTVPYVMFLSGNPARQLPLQMSTIPMHFGVTGGTTYGIKGGFSRDITGILLNTVSPGAGEKWIKTMGGDPELLARFQRSGVFESVDHHTFSAGTIGDISRAGGGGRFSSAASNTHLALRSVGIDAGIRMEKASAWLLAHNRFKVMNPGKPIGPAEEKQIANFAENMSNNPNASDVLPFQRGLAGFLTQFMWQQVKMVGRMASVIPGAPQQGFTKAENRKMAGILFLTYGLRGFGIERWARSLAASPTMQALPELIREEAVQTLTDGVANMLADQYLGEWVTDDADTKPTNLAITESFSPASHIGGTVALPLKVAQVFATGDWEMLAQARWQAPGLGVAKAMVETLDFAASVIGAPPLPSEDSSRIKTAAVVRKVMQKFPGLSNAMKMEMGLEWRRKYNTAGDPLAEATKLEGYMAFIGVKNREEMLAYELSTATSGRQMTDAMKTQSIRDLAYETSQWMFPLLDELVEGRVNYQVARQYIDENITVLSEGLPTELYAEYGNALKALVDKRGESRYAKVLERVMEQAGTGRAPYTQDYIEYLKNLPLEPAAKEALVSDMNRKLNGVQ